MRFRAWGLVLLLTSCCSTNWRETAPWNFPPVYEWNRKLEFSWENFVDKIKDLTAPPGKIYDPIMQNYQPDFSRE
jgi:hypothetical protein